MNYDPYYHHRRSIRLKGYDYSSDGYYFVTMCSLDRINIFASLSVGAGLAPALQYELAVSSLGQIINTPTRSSSPVFKLTRIGEILDKRWKEIPKNYNNITLDSFIVMPNHFHGIIVIGSGIDNIDSVKESTQTNMVNQSERAPASGAPTRKEKSLSEESITLGSVIGSFKSLCVNDNLRYIRENSLYEYGKIWQRDYYEHIIRNKRELNRIRKYIRSNPYNWLKDQANITNGEKIIPSIATTLLF